MTSKELHGPEKNSVQDTIGVVDRNIASVHAMRKRFDENRHPSQKFIDDVVAYAGSTKSLSIHLLFYGLCLGAFFFAPVSSLQHYHINVGTISLGASLEAIFLAVFVLISQRRLNSLENKNSALHLQMSLLVEHEITRIAEVTDLIARHLGVNSPSVKNLEEVKVNISPDQILNRISEHEKKSPVNPTD